MKNEHDLLPCPFCNCKNIEFDEDGLSCGVSCMNENCGFFQYFDGSTPNKAKNNAIAAWNTRAEIAAEQKTVDVEAIKLAVYEIKPTCDLNAVAETIHCLAAQGYLRTPDTEKDRVLELMAEAVSKILQKFDKDHSDSAWWYTTSDEVGLLEDAISEYEKLKGGA